MTYSDLTVDRDGAATGPRTAAPAAAAHETVDLFGDSLAYQAEPYLDMFFAETGNYTVSNNTYGGTATCDWLSKMAVAAAEHPQAAVLVFSGNAFTPCMDGVALRSPQYYARYTTDTEQAIATFGAVGPTSSWSGPRSTSPRWPGGTASTTCYRRLGPGQPPRCDLRGSGRHR